MGIIYKLNDKVKNFILKQKQKDPALSCRKLSQLIKEKLNISISKSQINNFLKSKNLSAPLGRPIKKIKLRKNLTGIYLLKLIDDKLLGLTAKLNENLKKRIKRKDLNLLNQALIFGSFFDYSFKPNSRLWAITGKRLTENYVFSYLKELEEVNDISSIFKNTLKEISQEVLAIKFTFSDSASFYLDGQMRSLWSSENIPYDFSITYYKTKSYIKNILKNKYFQVILFTAPGYEIVPISWFNFLIRFSQIHRYSWLQLSFLDDKFQTLEVLPINRYEITIDLIFSIWPWQYEKYRFLEDIKEEGVLEIPEKKFYISSAKMKLLQPHLNQSVTLNALILKKEPQTKPDIFIVTNRSPADPKQIAMLYLKRWPNLQEGFKYYAKKIELFTYHPLAKKIFPKEEMFNLLENKNLKDIYGVYLKYLDLYLHWYFLPLSYREKEDNLLRHLYNLPLRIKTKKEKKVEFILTIPLNYPYEEDLNYFAYRLSEGELFFGNRFFSLKTKKENVF